MRTLLKFPNSDQSEEALAGLGKYSLGTKRSFDDYMKFCGINTTALTQVQGDDNCIVYYVPWDDSGVKEEIMKAEGAVAEDSKAEDAVEDQPMKIVKASDIGKGATEDQSGVWFRFAIIIVVLVGASLASYKFVFGFLLKLGERKDK